MHTAYRHLFAFLMCFVFILLRASSAESALGTQPRVNELLEKGIMSCQNGNYEEGIQYFNSAIAMDPHNYFAHINRGIAYKDKNDPEHAVPDFNTCIQISPKNPEAHFQLGNVAANQGDFEAAVLFYTKAVTLDANCIKAYGARALIHTVTGQWSRAVDDINAAITREPEFPMLYIIRGQVLDLKGECRAALFDFEKAMSYDPVTFNANGNIAWILATCPDKEVRNGQKALALAKEELTARETHENLKILAAAYAETGDFDKAVDVQLKAIEKIRRITPVHRFEEICLQKDLTLYKDQLAAYHNRKPWHLRPPVPEINNAP